MANIKKYQKGENVKLSANFHLSEYECKCSNCSETLVDMDHVEKLQQLRHDLGHLSTSPQPTDAQITMKLLAEQLTHNIN